MEMCYDGTLVMPGSYAVMSEDEMLYVEGGETIAYNVGFLSKTFCFGYATTYKILKKWNNISCSSLAAEIFFHAALYYRGATVIGSWLAKAGGKIGNATKTISTSIGNGIDVENGRDTRTICGIQRWMIYETFYEICPGL